MEPGHCNLNENLSFSAPKTTLAGMSKSLRVLVVDDERELRESLQQILQQNGHEVSLAEDGESALKQINDRLSEILSAASRSTPELSGEEFGHELGDDELPASAPRPLTNFDMVLLDVNLPGMSGLDVLKQIRQIDPTITVLIITAHGNIRDAVEAMREGAYNYVEKPVQQSDIEELMLKASNASSLVKKMGLSRPIITLENGEEFIGESQQMRSVFEIIERLGHVNTSVLIRGENGTGKELVAQAIHFNSPRKDRPFVAVNCGAIPENLVESEFFGHEKGAFTGADARKIGKFQFTEGGTLFLDEIGDVSPAMQVKLLRVLQERKFMPVGSNREIRCDVRIIAATNRDLEALMEQNLFRQDLFYRLNVMPIHLPPLRERHADIPVLVDHFIEKFNQQHDRRLKTGPTGAPVNSEVLGIEPLALEAMRRYRWPGNIRELENVIERAFVMEAGNLIRLESLPEAITLAAAEEAPPSMHALSEDGSIDFPINYQGQKERFERDFIVRALRRFSGRINQTVAHAGIPKNTLLRKIRKYKIQPSDYTNA